MLALLAATGTVSATTTAASGKSAAPLPSAAAGSLAIGLGDQQPDMFNDPRFLALGVHYARLSIPWDALNNSRQANVIATWLRAAHRDGVEPLISFDHSYLRSHFRKLPTPNQFAAAFQRLHRRYPWVMDFATWNEANYCGEPTCHRAGLVANYFKALQKAFARTARSWPPSCSTSRTW